MARRSPAHLGAVLELADAIGREANVGLTERDFASKVSPELLALIEAARTNAVNVHGRRTELMFGYVAASLGASRVVKREDAGDVYVAGGIAVLTPDYRLLLKDGSQQLVEVKNCHHRSPSKELAFRESDVAALRAYAAEFGLPLAFAIYWSRWHVWTLLSPEDMRLADGKYRTTLKESLMRNQMGDIGDFHLATTPPAVLRIVASPTEPRDLREDGQVNFTIGDVKLFAGDTEVTDKKERDLLLYMMFYGKWVSQETVPTIVDGKLEYIDTVAVPLDLTPDQPFELVGAMSTMISNEYLQLTTEGVRRLTPSAAPGKLGRRQPGRVKEMTLPLWVFTLKPSEGDSQKGRR